MRRTARLLPHALVGLAAAVLMFWSLGEKYLWQDEAQTAVLATRLLRFGAPLAYDGVNFVSLDTLSREEPETMEFRDQHAATEVDFYVGHGYLRANTAWKWHPWGQFVAAGASIAALGQTTVAARLPFALAGLMTVFLLYRLVMFYCASGLMALVSAILLTFNAYWILHARQCRYYSPSSFFLMLTLLSYMRWQRKGKWSRTLFVASAWCWFQFDYGTVLPVLLILFVDACVSQWPKPWKTLPVWLVLALLMAPFVWYYGLSGRSDIQQGTWLERFRENTFNTNEFILAAPIVAGALLVLIWRWKKLPGSERRLVAVSCGMILSLGIWVPTVTITAFLRYSIVLAPVGCFITAWLIVRAVPGRFAWIVWPITAILVITPWASLPLHGLIPPPRWDADSTMVRAELKRLRREVFDHPDDPNRDVIEWLRKNASPTDEILIDYEDLPLVYYLRNPIRGGIAGFRIEDDEVARPRFLVLRPHVGFVNWALFRREAAKYRWKQEPVAFPEALWGNNPDPMSGIAVPAGSTIGIWRRLDN